MKMMKGEDKMKWRVKKKQLKRYERKTYAILLRIDYPVIITKRRKTILRLHKVKPWMLNEVMIRYTIADRLNPYLYRNDPYSYTNYVYNRSSSLEKGGIVL